MLTASQNKTQHEYEEKYPNDTAYLTFKQLMTFLHENYNRYDDEEVCITYKNKSITIHPSLLFLFYRNFLDVITTAKSCSYYKTALNNEIEEYIKRPFGNHLIIKKGDM